MLRSPGATKTCTVCKEAKALYLFGKYKASKDGKHYRCKACGAAKTNLWRSLNTDPAERSKLESRRIARFPLTKRVAKHHISLDRYWLLMEIQNFACTICEEKQTPQSFVIDHNHKCCPGEYSCGACVRSLLCARCNHGIGHLREDADIIIGALAYVKRWS